jgi:hypothetical protein
MRHATGFIYPLVGMKDRRRLARHPNQKCLVADTYVTWDAYIRSWPKNSQGCWADLPWCILLLWAIPLVGAIIYLFT